MDSFGDSDSINFGGGGSSSRGAQSRRGSSLKNNQTDRVISNNSDAFVYEWFEFKEFWDRALSFYQPVEIGIIALGLVGNILAFLTLLRSRKMNVSPSFLYHRVLVAADLLFCVTYFLHMIVKKFLSVPCHNTFYRYRIGAYFSGTLNPAINYVCGYLLMYMTLVIALDRFLALLLIEKYRKWNTKKVAYVVTLGSILLSAGVHCWAYFAQNTVVKFRLSDELDESTSIISRPCWIDPVVYHWTKRENVSDQFRKAVKAKDYYNGAVRVGYPICLCILTLGVLIGFAKRRKKRRHDSLNNEASSVGGSTTASPAAVVNRSRILSSTSSQRKTSVLTVRSDRSSSILSNISSVFGAASSFISQHQHRIAQSPSLRHRQRCERALFCLMIAVVLLAFVQVASSESRRILHLIFPPDEVFKQKVLPSRLPMRERIANFRFLLYGHQATRIVANLCTAIDRSFVCFLYFSMNHLFRRELLSILSGAFCFVRNHFHARRASASNRRDSTRRSRSIQVEPRASLIPPPSPSPISLNFPGTLPFATDRGYAGGRSLGENL